MKSVNQRIHLPILDKYRLSFYIKREDLIHPTISGNKYRKLKYNLRFAKKAGHNTLLTFGGAYSNHILATAIAGKEHKFRTVGVIRGDELKDNWQNNPTLVAADKAGMLFYFISRKQFREKNTSGFLRSLQERYGNYYLLPEGGTNDLAVQGCQEILTPADSTFDYICSSVGTGGTLAGLINSSTPEQRIFGFPALKGDFLKKDICKFASNENWQLLLNYHFGGYAKIDEELIQFINQFKRETQILLDPIYTAKMIYGIIDLVKRGHFPKKSSILAIHTGGLQGIAGMNIKLKERHLPLIAI